MQKLGIFHLLALRRHSLNKEIYRSMTSSIVPSPSKFLRQPTILIVEDNLNSLFYLDKVLKTFNYNCLAASTAMDALSLAHREQPDLILVDICMPQINGIELLNILRTDWLTRNIPAIAITALAGVEEQQEVLDAGFNRCLFKPYLLKDLESAINACLPSQS